MIKSNLTVVYLGERSYMTDLYTKEFKKKGVEMLFVESSSEAQRLLTASCSDILLVNINNTRVNSCQMLCKLKSLVSVPVVAIGVVRSEGEKDRYIKTCGASAFIEEPLAVESCLEEIKKILKQSVRAEPRLQADKGAVSAKVFCSYDGLTVESKLVDLSTKGMKVLCPQKMPSGRRLCFVVKLELGQEIFTLNTETMIEPSEGGLEKSGHFYAYRILFVNLSLKEEDLLRGLINSYVKGDSSFSYYG